MELRLPLVSFFDPAGDTRRAKSPAQSPRPAALSDRRLFCATCRHPITHQDHAVAVGGAHEHRCTNPAGLQFRIGCFREAKGCIELGEATTEHTWFAGCAWRVALCAKCRAHLGWRFDGDDVFYGLILGRLRATGPAA
jgi:hypothetical protein